MAHNPPGIGGMSVYTPSLPIGPRTVDVVFAATTNGTVYAFDANGYAASSTEEGLLWRTPLRGHGEEQYPHGPYGVLSTPVIDLNAKTLYAVSRTRENNTDDFYLYKLDIRDGKILHQTKIAAPGFIAAWQNQRPALLLDRGMIYIGFGMWGGEGKHEYHGWVLRYDAQAFTLADWFNPSSLFTCSCCDKPDCHIHLGAGVWQGGGGLAADDDGDVYVMTENGLYDPDKEQFGDSFIKLGLRNGRWGLVHHFTPPEANSYLSRCDLDLSAGGPLLIPGADRLVGGGKTGELYVLNQSTLQLAQQSKISGVDYYRPDTSHWCYWEGGPHLHGSPAFWHGSGGDYVYIWAEQDYLRRFAFRVDGTLDPTPVNGNLVGPECLDSGLSNGPGPDKQHMCPMPAETSDRFADWDVRRASTSARRRTPTTRCRAPQRCREARRRTARRGWR
jgi:outer membrane protein assembly factor BamB